MNRQMVLVGFLQAQNCTNLPSSWRHPDSRDDSMSADYYQEIARILEGDPSHKDHWDDIAGYAKLIAERSSPAA